MIDYAARQSGLLVPRGNAELIERIAELEFASEDRDWLQLANGGRSEFSRDGLRTITHIARLMFLKNPLILRGVKTQANYVWGRSVTITAKDPDINDVIQQFLDDEDNQREFTAQAARIQKEIELQCDGNVFFVFFRHKLTGRVRLTSMPVDEIREIVTDPQNRKKPWFYLREWSQETFDLVTGNTTKITKRAYYPDWRYKPDLMPSMIGGIRVETATVYHVRVGGFSDWKFGVSEVYAAIDWSKAYKTFLENWSTIVAAYARFAWKVTTAGGTRGIAAARARLGTTVGNGDANIETNPPSVAGATLIRGQSADGKPQMDIEPVKTAGATTHAEDGRRLLLMVAAAQGLPETFYGDASVGSLATAQSLDRPTELAFMTRQQMWADIIEDIVQYVIFNAVAAPAGVLRDHATIGMNEYGEEILEYNDGIDTHIDVDFPPIVVDDVLKQVQALKTAATLDGAAPMVIKDLRQLAKMMLTVIGADDIDETLDLLYPEGSETQYVPPAPIAPVGGDPFNKAISDVKEAMYKLVESLNNAPTITT